MAVHLAQKFPQDFLDRVFSISMTDSVHSDSEIGKNKKLVAHIKVKYTVELEL